MDRVLYRGRRDRSSSGGVHHAQRGSAPRPLWWQQLQQQQQRPRKALRRPHVHGLLEPRVHVGVHRVDIGLGLRGQQLLQLGDGGAQHAVDPG